VSGNRAEGHVGAGKDGLTASGDMPRIHLEQPDNARVMVNGKAYHTIVIDGSAGSGSTQYSIGGGGQLTQVEGELAGHNVTIQANDNVRGTEAQGHVGAGKDGVIVSGEMPEIDLQDPQSAQVFIDGQLFVSMEMPETQVMPETNVLSQ